MLSITKEGLIYGICRTQDEELYRCLLTVDQRVDVSDVRCLPSDSISVMKSFVGEHLAVMTTDVDGGQLFLSASAPAPRKQFRIGFSVTISSSFNKSLHQVRKKSLMSRKRQRD